MTTEAPKPCDILIRNGYVISMNNERTIYASGAVAVSGCRIVDVGPERDVAPRYKPKRTIDAEGGVVQPGGVDAHTHVTLHLTRGAVPDNPKAKSPVNYASWFNAITDEDEYTAAEVTAVEMLRNGYTTVMDPGTTLQPDAIAKAAQDVGIRISVSDPFLWDAGDEDTFKVNRAPRSMKRALELMGRELRRNREKDTTVHAHVCVYGGDTTSEELMWVGRKCADDNGVVLNQHFNFTPDQAATVDSRFGNHHSLVKLGESGFLAPNVTFVHMNVIRDDEMQPIVNSGMSLVWHAGNYMFYGIQSKVKSRMAELMGRGVNVTFGVDAAKCWTFGEMEFYGYLVARQAGEYISAEKMLESKTIGAARALGLEKEIGSLEPGKRADIAILRHDLPEGAPGVNVIQEMMLFNRASATRIVIVNGQVVWDEGAPTRIDQAAAVARGRESTRRVLRKMDHLPAPAWPVMP